MNTIAEISSPVSGALRPIPLMRSSAELMRPEALAAIQPSRVSSARYLMSKAIREKWIVTRKSFDIDDRARGSACYLITAGSWQFSFPVLSFEPSGSGRTGRIIGRAWDMMGALIEGDVPQASIDATAEELPKLYRGRAVPGTLTWCRSNRSSRLFDLAIKSLSEGGQPPIEELARTCYLMRNTGIDGNGTFGTKNFLTFETDHPLRTSLSAQLLTAYMMRVFACDLVDHLVRTTGGARAAAMNADYARFMGVGNGSALGLMFFVNNHPRLIDRWLRIREEAIGCAKLLRPGRDAAEIAVLRGLVDRAITFRRQDRAEYEHVTDSNLIADDLAVVARELRSLESRLREGVELSSAPLADLCASLDGRILPDALETLQSLMIELVPETADTLAGNLVVDEELVGRPEMNVARLRDIVRNEYAWCFALDLASERARRFVWYKSRSAEEPRRGPREEVGDVHNLGLDLPRLIVQLDSELAQEASRTSIARFVAQRPHLRHIVTRVQALNGLPYHSPHANIMGEDFVPAHITRLLNVGLHGIDKTRDFLDRNLRGVLFHGAPLAGDLNDGIANPHWFYPPEPTL